MNSWLGQALVVGVGGFLGAVLRFGVGTAVTRRWAGLSFPLGTLLVNWAGCLLIGLMLGAVEPRHALSPTLRLFVMVGLLGGFTTFSAFGGETLLLLRDGHATRAFANVAAQVIGGLGMAWLGFRLSGGLTALAGP